MATLKQIHDANPHNSVLVVKNNNTQILIRLDDGFAVFEGGMLLDENEGGWEIVKPPLSQLQTEKILQIDNKTQEIIFRGFQHNGHTFSLSQNAQQNWSALMVYLVAGMLSFPFNVTTFDDNEYSIQDQAEFVQFIQTAFYAVSSQISAGRVIKLQVVNATTYEELDAVIDPRT